MKISWVMSDCERKSRVTKSSGKGTQLSPSTANLIIPKNCFSHKLTMEEQLQVGAMVKVFYNYTYDKYLKKLALDKDFMHKSVLMFTSSGSSDFSVFDDVCVKFEDSDMKAVVEYGFDMPEMRSLPAFDRMNLMCKNHKLVFGLMSAAYHKPTDIQQFFSNFLDYGMDKGKVDKDIDNIMKEMNRLSLDKNGESMAVQPIDQAAIVQFWQHRLRHANDQETAKISEAVTVLSQVMCQQGLDNYLLILMTRMLLFGDTGDTLEDPAKVENLREAQAWLMFRYLKTTYGQAASGMFHKLLMLEDTLHTVHDVFRQDSRSAV